LETFFSETNRRDSLIKIDYARPVAICTHFSEQPNPSQTRKYMFQKPKAAIIWYRFQSKFNWNFLSLNS